MKNALDGIKNGNLKAGVSINGIFIDLASMTGKNSLVLSWGRGGLKDFGIITDFDQIKGLSSLTQLRSLYIQNHKIKVIKGLEQLVNLERLNLEGNCIEKIQGLENLTKLKWLLLNNNEISQIEGLENFELLEKLDLGANKIEEIKGLENLPSLKELDLHSNRITVMTGLEQLENLEHLYLNNNLISEIQGLGTLSKLRIINLRSNLIEEIKNLDTIPDLFALLLGTNCIQEIPQLENLPRLSELDLSWNKISEIKNLDLLTSLSGLNLDHNIIDRISGLDSLVNLKELKLHDNRIKKIEGLEHLQHLEKLKIGSNRFSNLYPIRRMDILKPLLCAFSNEESERAKEYALRDPENAKTALAGIKGDLARKHVKEMLDESLEDFNTFIAVPKKYVEFCKEQAISSDNQEDIVAIEAVSDEAFLAGGSSIRCKGKIINLQEGELSVPALNIKDLSEIDGLDQVSEFVTDLFLGNNEFESLDGFEQFSNLEKLNMIGNHLKSTKGLENLVNLKEIYFSDNQIEKIEGLSNLINLEKLDLENNKIKKLEGLEENINLRQLNMERNFVTRIENLQNLVNLEELNLQNNRIYVIEGMENLAKLNCLKLNKNLLDDRLVIELGGYDGDLRIASPNSFVRYCKDQLGMQSSSLDCVTLIHKQLDDNAWSQGLPIRNFEQKRALLRNEAVMPFLLAELKSDLFRWHLSQFYKGIYSDRGLISVFETICLLNDVHVECISNMPDLDGYIYFCLESNDPSGKIHSLIGRFILVKIDASTQGLEIYPELSVDDFETTFQAIKTGDDDIHHSLSDYLSSKHMVRIMDLQSLLEKM
ncbi:MAG TPA: leucine-rich repeat domain-containing protein [Candidatus Lokiarchaeia archaeon]|nr:leucine-rich repeat domain-containing protein [Candidatus Lokiarchaeia archaeon]